MPGLKESPQACMERAMELAAKSLPWDVPVGAFVLDPSGKVIGEGWNTREIEHNPYGHAEMMAMAQAAKALGNWRLEDCTLCVTLEPCPMCASALMQARLGKVIYGAYDPVQGAFGSAMSMDRLYPHTVEIVGGVSEAACREQLQRFFQERRQSH